MSVWSFMKMNQTQKHVQPIMFLFPEGVQKCIKSNKGGWVTYPHVNAIKWVTGKIFVYFIYSSWINSNFETFSGIILSNLGII